jgi:hypothetical protein
VKPNALLDAPDFVKFNSIERARALADWAQRHSSARDAEIGPLFWRLAEQEWSGFDAIDHYAYEGLFYRFRPYWRAPESGFYKSLPERFIAYRGAPYDEEYSGFLGLSWTLNRTVARGFARGHRGLWNDEPIIFAAVIDRTNVALALIDRKESELVLFEPPSPYRFVPCREATRRFEI